MSRSQISALSIGMIAVLVIGTAVGEFSLDKVSSDASARLVEDSKRQPGRFTIFMDPNVRADKFLLDTSTGRCFQIVSLDHDPEQPKRAGNAWRQMPFIQCNESTRSPDDAEWYGSVTNISRMQKRLAETRPTTQKDDN